MSWSSLLAAAALCVAAADAFKIHYADKNYNPDVDLTTSGILRRHGYPAESHTVLTEDGYLLTMHRVPRVSRSLRRKIPVLLQHGLLGSSADWVFLGPGRGLAYRLFDMGYDVWMNNVRGNTYSQAHSNMSIDDPAYWDFSWHEMGMYDVPAAINHVLRSTGSQEVFYVGHSMGTTMFYVMASQRPEYGDKVRAMFSLAPVGYMGHMRSPIRYFAPAANDLRYFMHLFGENEFLTHSKAVHFLTLLACELTQFEEHVCEEAIFSIVGFDPDQFNKTLITVFLGHSPAGTSTKTVAHYAQEIQSNKFRQFDYGKEKNLERYGVESPPKYDLSKIRTPISLHYASNDWLASIEDVERLNFEIPNVMFSGLVPLQCFNHLDFIMGNDVPSLVYTKVEKLMEKMYFNADAAKVR